MMPGSLNSKLVADLRSEQTQRDWGLQPKVGVQRLPWVRVRKLNQRQRRWVARAICPFRRATSPAEARRQVSRFASFRHDKVPVQAWSASCRPEQAGSLFHPSGGNQYETFGSGPYRSPLQRDVPTGL